MAEPDEPDGSAGRAGGTGPNWSTGSHGESGPPSDFGPHGDFGRAGDAEREAAGLPPEVSDQPADPPNPVRVSFWLWVASAAALCAGFIVMLLRGEAVIDAVIEANPDAGITADEIAAGAPTVLWTVALAGFAFALLFLLFAYKMRDGTRSARSALVVLTLVMMAFHLAMGPFVNPLTVTAIVLAAAAVALSFLPRVAHHFPDAPRRRRRWRQTG